MNAEEATLNSNRDELGESSQYEYNSIKEKIDEACLDKKCYIVHAWTYTNSDIPMIKLMLAREGFEVVDRVIQNTFMDRIFGNPSKKVTVIKINWGRNIGNHFFPLPDPNGYNPGGSY